MLGSREARPACAVEARTGAVEQGLRRVSPDSGRAG